MILKHLNEKCLKRHLHPSIYDKIELTESLLKKGIAKEDLKSLGGLDYDTYNALQRRWEAQVQRSMEYKQEVRTKYGSLKNAPPSVGPCGKHEPVVGTKNALVLLTEFNDKKHSHEASEFNDLLFNKEFKQSMRNYYLEASWNQLDIKGHVNDEWYTSTGNRIDYADDPTNLYYPKAQKLVVETIKATKNRGKIDFSPYSVDGKIEILFVVYAGSGMDVKLDKSFIRPHQYHLPEPMEVQEGIFAYRYCLIPELPIDDIGAFCHELGHILGLPDLYMEGYGPVVGSWCLMGFGDHINDGKTPAHPSAWCKLHLGWTEPQPLNQIPQKHEIPSIIDDKTIYKVEIHGSNGKEYFLLENRQQKGFDENLPSSGLLIWHVDENACLKQAPNFDPNHFFLTLKQSDGKEDLQKDRRELIKIAKKTHKPPKELKDILGDEGDPFPGKTVNRNFSDESNPNSRSYKGDRSFVEAISISDSDNVMNAEIGVDLKSDRTYSPTNEITSRTEKQRVDNFINPYLLYFLFQKEKKDDKESENISHECLPQLKEKTGLNFYGKGYQWGYLQGYSEVLKFYKKFKK